jgi:hypothetical protein
LLMPLHSMTCPDSAARGILVLNGLLFFFRFRA